MAKCGKVILRLIALISPDLEPTMDLYVYYRVLASDAKAFLARACAFLHRLRVDGRIDASLSRRPESKDGFDTWMEVIPQAGDAVDQTLASWVASSGMGGVIHRERHVERFVRVF